MNVYDIGDVARVSATFTVGGTATDPTAITAKVQAPDLTETSYVYGVASVVRSSAGAYYLDIPCAAAGRYRVRWVGTGAAAAAEEASFTVRASNFASP